MWKAGRVVWPEKGRIPEWAGHSACSPHPQITPPAVRDTAAAASWEERKGSVALDEFLGFKADL